MSKDVPFFFPCRIVCVKLERRCGVGYYTRLVLHSPPDFTSCLPAGLEQMIKQSGLIEIRVMVPEVGTTKERSCCISLSFQTNWYTVCDCEVLEYFHRYYGTCEKRFLECDTVISHPSSPHSNVSFVMVGDSFYWIGGSTHQPSGIASFLCVVEVP